MFLSNLREELLPASILVGIMAAAPTAHAVAQSKAAPPAPTAHAVAQSKAAPPDFSSNNVGWVGLNGGGPFYEPVPGGIPPVTQDPAHPFVPNGAGRQPTFRIADLSNSNLKPWVKERMKKDNDEVLAGKVAFTPGSSCVPQAYPASWVTGAEPHLLPSNPTGSLDNTQ